MNENVILLEQLIKFKENDFLLDKENGRVEEVVEHHLIELIIGVSRYVNDISYCSKGNCSCCPEWDIKHQYYPIKDYLKTTKRALFPIPTWTIEKIIESVK